MSRFTLTKLRLTNFRSIVYEAIEFNNPMYLVGRNGAGKSNVVDVLAVLSEAMEEPLSTVIDKRGGIFALYHRFVDRPNPQCISIAVDAQFLSSTKWSGTYEFSLLIENDGSYRVLSEKCDFADTTGKHVWFDRSAGNLRSNAWEEIRPVRPRLEPTSLLLPLFGVVKRFAPIVRGLADMRVYSINPAVIRGIQTLESQPFLRADGSNLASILYRMQTKLPESSTQAKDFLAAVLGGLLDIGVQRQGNHLVIEFDQKSVGSDPLRFDASLMSEGTLASLGLITSVLQPRTPTVIVLEQPENSVHPGALGVINDLILLASRRSQVVVTTQSPELLDAKWIGPANLRIVQWRTGRTTVSTLGEAPSIALRTHLMGAGELLRANALDPASREEEQDDRRIAGAVH